MLSITRKRFWRFSCTLAMSRAIWKGYLSYDSDSRHLCLHGGRAHGKHTLRLDSYPATGLRENALPKKARKKVLHV